MFIIVGLGNPGEEYEKTRHNSGRIVLSLICKKHGFSEWKEDIKIKSLVSKGEIDSKKVFSVLPNNFMNNSGKSVAPLISSKKKLEKLVVIYDDIDLPLGAFKISYNKSSGGHKGLESIIRALRSKEFIRIRAGISPITPSGKIRKPKGEKKVLDFLIGDFKKKELEILKKLSKKIDHALSMIISEGKEKAMSLFNQ